MEVIELNEMQKLQNHYSQLCGQRGHLESQIIVAEDQIAGFQNDMAKNLIELKAIIKQISELNKKNLYDQQKAAEAAAVAKAS